MRSGWELFVNVVTEAHPTQAVHPRIASLLVQALKHESKSTGPNSHPTSVAGLLEVGKVRVACPAAGGIGSTFGLGP